MNTIIELKKKLKADLSGYPYFKLAVVGDTATQLLTPDVIIHSQDIMFKNPVFMNDELDFLAKVEEISEAVNTVIFH